MSDFKKFWTSEPAICLAVSCAILYFRPSMISLFLCTVITLYKFLER